jgi:hypothetical protein
MRTSESVALINDRLPSQPKGEFAPSPLSYFWLPFLRIEEAKQKHDELRIELRIEIRIVASNGGGRGYAVATFIVSQKGRAATCCGARHQTRSLFFFHFFGPGSLNGQIIVTDYDAGNNVTF